MKKIKQYFKNMFLAVVTDKAFLNAIIPILEILSKSTNNKIDDTIITLLKNEALKMDDTLLKDYKED